jgi:Putative zinc-finger
MSEAIQNNDTPSQCDRLLDYVYGELSGDDLEQFKLHLLSCEKCKRELQGLERVRSAVKQSMPPVEPPVDKMAQLMLAAAQQKPKRGKVLMFARRVVSHPAYAAAAVFVLVATSVTINWSRHALQMPAPEAVHEPVAPTSPVVAAPAGGEKELQAAPPAEIALDAPEKARDKNKEPTIQLKTEPETFTVRRAQPAKKGGKSDLVLRPAFDGAKSSGGGSGAAMDDFKAPAQHAAARPAAGKDEEVAATGRVAAAKPAAPPPAKPKLEIATEGYYGKRGSLSREGGLGNAGDSSEMMVQAPAKETAAVAQNQAPQGTATPPAPPPPPQAAPATSSPALMESKAQQRTDNSNTRQQKTVDPMQLKKQFLGLVSGNRCPEAVTLYQQIDRQYSNLFTDKENMEYVRCLRQTGQNDLANMVDKRIQEQTKINAMRASKKAKKAEPAAKPADADSLLAPVSK